MDRLKVLTLHRPLAIFPSKLWKILCREAKACELSDARLRKLYLRHCIFSGWNRSGTNVRKFIKRECGLHVLRLDALALQLFTTYEVAQVLELQYTARTATKHSIASRELEGILVVSKTGPTEPFMVFGGFPTEGPKADAMRQLRKGDTVVIQHFGVLEGVRQDVAFVDVGTNQRAMLYAREDARSSVAFEDARERATDAVQKAQETIQQRDYCISFVKFARTLLLFTTLPREEVASLAVTLLYRDGELDNLIQILHSGCSRGPGMALLQAWMKDRLHSKEPDDIIAFFVRYPIFFVPLLLVQKTIHKYTFGHLPEADPLNPVTQHDAWTTSARRLVMDVLIELGIRKTPVPADDPYLLRSAGEKEKDAFVHRRSEDSRSDAQRKQSSRLLLLGLESISAGSDSCPGCAAVAPIQSCGVCHACETVVKHTLASRGGYQYARGVIDKACGLPLHVRHLPTHAIYIEEFDEQADTNFFYDVSTGESMWELPTRLHPAARVHRLTKRDMVMLKERRRPEWRRSLVVHESKADDDQ